MDAKIGSFLDAHLSDAYQLLNKQAGQFLLVSPDEVLLSLAQDAIASHTDYKPVCVENEKDFTPDKKIFFITLQNKRNVGYQSLLYYYLELPLRHNCFVCLFSSSSLCLNYFEKRVQSRFKHFILFIPYYPRDGAGMPGGFVLPSLHERHNYELMAKYQLERYTLSFFFNILEPVHIAMLILVISRRTKRLNLVTEYRQFILSCRELKGVNSTELFYKYCDLLDAGLISQNGDFFIDISELREHVHAKCPNYLKQLLRTSRI